MQDLDEFPEYAEEWMKEYNDSTIKLLLSEESKRKSNINFHQVVPDSHYYDELTQILLSLNYLLLDYQLKEEPGSDFVQWPPISIEYMIKGIENTIERGYKLVKEEK